MTNAFTLRKPPSTLLFYNGFPWHLATGYVSMKNIKVLCNQSRVGISQHVMGVNAFLTIRHLFLPTFSFFVFEEILQKRNKEIQKLHNSLPGSKLPHAPLGHFCFRSSSSSFSAALALRCSAGSPSCVQTSLVVALRLQSTPVPHFRCTGLSRPEACGILVPQPGIEPESL